MLSIIDHCAFEFKHEYNNLIQYNKEYAEEYRIH